MESQKAEETATHVQRFFEFKTEGTGTPFDIVFHLFF
jgi:hypothetical protein